MRRCRSRLPRDVEQSREGKIDSGFTPLPEFAWGLLSASMGRVHSAKRVARRIGGIARSCYPGSSTRRTDRERGLERRARARLKPRIGRVPGRRRRRGSPGGFDRCSGATRPEALALPLIPRRGRASGDGVGCGEGPTDGPRCVFRASRAAGAGNNETPVTDPG